MYARKITAAVVAALAAAALTGCTANDAASAPSGAPLATSPAPADPSSLAAPTPSASTPVAAPSAPGAPTPTPTSGEPDAGDDGTVHPTLTFAGKAADGGYELSGVVADLIEDGGTCTFFLSLGDTRVVRTQAGLADASSTSCGTVAIARSELSAGTWMAVLVYSGAGGSGTSRSSMVQVS